MTLKDLIHTIPFISLLFAGIALFFSFRSNRIARKAYLLSLKQDERQRPSLNIYIIDSYIRPPTQTIPNVHVFHIRITNTSDARNAIQELRLVVEHGKSDEIKSNFSILHDASFAQNLQDNQLEPLTLPCALDARTVKQGLAIFSIPEDLIKDSQIESYSLRATDTFDNILNKEVVLLKEDLK